MRPDANDRRFVWLQSSLLRLYNEVEPDAHVTAVAIEVFTAEGTRLHYTAGIDRPDIGRSMLTPEAEAISREFVAATVDLTPEPAP
jgi:hypothetical protein